MDVLDALGRQPLADLEDADDRCPRPRGDRDGIADVIAVAVRDEDEIGLDLVGLERVKGLSLRNGSRSKRCSPARIDQALWPSQVISVDMRSPWPSISARIALQFGRRLVVGELGLAGGGTSKGYCCGRPRSCAIRRGSNWPCGRNRL